MPGISDDPWGLLPPTRLGIEGTESAVTVGVERVHAECIGEREGLVAMDFRWLARRRLAPHSDLAEEVQGIRLIAPFLMRTGERQRPLRK